MKCKWGFEMNTSGLKGKRILIAGGTGFIGRRVTSYLSDNGVEVFVLTRKQCKDEKNIIYWRADLNNHEELAQYSSVKKFDAVIYMAANIPEIGQKKESYYDAKCSTLDPFVNFCDCFLSNSKTLIYISSIDVLGKCDILSYDEEAVHDIATPYGLAKYCGEFYAKDMCESLGIGYKIYRFSQVYGPEEPLVRIIPILKKAILNGTEFNLYTDGSEKRRFLFVDDAVQAIACGLLSDINGVFNIAGQEIISMKDLIRMMEAVWEQKINIKILNQIVGRDNVPSIDKACHELSFKPAYSMYEGLMKIKEEENREKFK